MKKNEQVSLKALVKTTILEWLKDSTCHALPNMARSKNIIWQIICFCCFLASMVYCTYSVASSIHQFYQYDTITSLMINDETAANFPAISFCNLKRFNKNVAKDLIANAFFKNNTPVLDFASYGDNIYDYFNDMSEILESSVSDYNQSAEFMRSLGFELSDMLITCIFDRKRCTTQDFKYFFHPVYGNCFSFNNNISSVKQASVQGMIISFYFIIICIHV